MLRAAARVEQGQARSATAVDLLARACASSVARAIEMLRPSVCRAQQWVGVCVCVISVTVLFGRRPLGE